MTLYKPLDLPWQHSVYDGVPIPPFITEKKYIDVREKHVSRPGDIFIATYPKSGTTWLQHIVNQLLNEPQGKDLHIEIAAPWILDQEQSFIDNMKSPRIFKSHDKWKWITKSSGVKYIYCYRNPKDVAVSSYFQLIRLNSFAYEGSIHDFMRQVFLKENAASFGSYIQHVSEWLAQGENKDILFLTYEDMKEDLQREVQKIVTFLNCNVDDERVKGIVENSTFGAMSDNDNVNYSWNKNKKDSSMKFLRKGEVGDWMNYLSEQHSKEIEDLVDEHLIPLGAKIRYRLE